MTPQKMKIIGIDIGTPQFDAVPSRHTARVQFMYDLSGTGAKGTADCLCQSHLPGNAARQLVLDDLIANGLGQLRRMPEVWLGETTLSLDLVAGAIQTRPRH